MISYVYRGSTGFNPSIVGKVWDGCIVEEKEIQPEALNGMVERGILVQAKPAKVTITKSVEEDKS